MASGIERLLNEARRSLDADDFSRCEVACRQVLQLDADQLDALRLLGVVARKTDRLALSLELLSRATLLAEARVKTDPRFAEIAAVMHFEWAVSLELENQHDAALSHYFRAVALNGNFFEAHINAAAKLEKAYRFADALPLVFKAAELNPSSPTALYNLGNVLRELGHIEHAARSYQQSLAIRPGYTNAHMNLATCLLLLQHYETGWQEYEFRGPSGEVVIDNYPQPRWQGESLSGKTLLIHAEQGIGDEILFASCFGEAIAQAARVILVCEPRLVTLFSRSFPQARVIGWTRHGDRSPCDVGEPVDVQIAAGSLPLLLRTSLASFPKRSTFLKADPQLVATWRKRFDQFGDGVKIGISWRAGGKPGERRRRTTELTLWRDLLSLPGVQFVNLQYGECGNDLAEVKRTLGVEVFDHAEGDPLLDVDSFAAKLAALDEVVSVGNATAHLAGAVGVSASVLLPRVPAWRWQIAGETSPWYQSVRLFRQTGEGWDDVLAQVVDRLHTKLGIAKSLPKPATQATIIAAINLPPSKPGGHGLAVDFASGPLAFEQLPDALQIAVGYFERGELSQAEAICRNILLHAPRYFDAQHLLGVIAFRTGRLDLAIRSLRRAIAVGEQMPLVHINLGHALRDSDQLEAAAASYARAVELDGQSQPALFALGVVSHRLGQHAQTVDCLARVLAMNVESADVWLYLGLSRRALCQTDAAIDALRHSLRIAPSVAAHAALGELLAEDGSTDEALSHLQAAVALEPRSATRHCTLGQVLMQADCRVEAQDCFRRAVKIDTANFDAWYLLADALRVEGRAIEAIDAFRRAAKLQADNPQPHHQLGRLLHDLGRLDEALACYDAAIERNPRFAPARFHRGLLRLQLGDLAEGWRDYEWRWLCGDGARLRDYFTQPIWDGSPLAGKTILIHGEQGVGDEVMFASCLPDVIAQAEQVIVLCQPRLGRLFARSFPKAQIETQPRDFEHQWQPPANRVIDFQIAVGSLPRFLRNMPATFPRSEAFLHADSQLIATWRARYAELGGGLKVGISWRAGIGPEQQRQRCTTLDAWLPVLQTPGAQFIDLQYGDHTADLLAARQLDGVKLHRWADADPLGDLDRFAAQIAALDLVITVGNATVHLAGALGVPTWNLLPTFGGWRWPLAGEETPWYRSVRVIRQPQPCNWQPLFNSLAERLQTFIAERPKRASA